MSLARSKRIGESVEGAVIQAVPELDPVADRDAHVDAEVVETIDPRPDLPTVGLAVVERGAAIEIKSCGAVVTTSQQRGRFYLRRQQHEYLLDVAGSYLFAVTPPHKRTPLAMKIVPATAVADVLSSWIDPDGREPYAQVSWSRIFDVAEVDPDAGGGPR